MVLFFWKGCYYLYKWFLEGWKFVILLIINYFILNDMIKCVNKEVCFIDIFGYVMISVIKFVKSCRNLKLF